MRLLSGFAAVGMVAAGATAATAAARVAAVPSAASAASVAAACRVPAGRPVVHTGRAAAGSAGATVRAPRAVIRVDQLGYPTGAAKLAEIMTSPRFARSHPRGIGWELLRRGKACEVAASGITRTDLGSWSLRYPSVWAVTFAGVRRSGTYRLALAGRARVVSPWFRIGPSRTLYARALANALSFYQNERDGPDFIPSALRTAPGHLSDASAMTYRRPPVNANGDFKGSLRPYATGVRINATGGWWDAGDYLHFTETTSYAVAMMLQGIVAFPRVLGSGGQVSFTAEARFGLDFLQRMWNERTRALYLQVGTGEANSYYFGDHDIWRLPQADDHYHGSNLRYQYIRHPPVFRAGPPGARISPNLAGRLAADFALCYRVFRATAPAYASRCLRSAETIYALAATRWHGRLETTLPWDFYPETSWRDDMMFGATELALALQAARAAGTVPAGLQVSSSATYLRDAARWASEWIGSKGDRSDTLNLYDVGALADYELYHAIAAQRAVGSAPLLPVSQAELVADLRGQIRRAAGIGRRDPFGFGFAWDQWDTTTHGLGMSIMAGEYDALVGGPVFAAWGQRQLDDVLGANAWGVSLIVGDGTVFPDCMQHQVANLVGSHDGRPPILAGAVVEGPNSFAAVGSVPNMRPCSANAPGNLPYSMFRGHKAVFRDNVQSYSTVEPAIDLGSLSPLAFAWQQAARRAGF